MAARPRPILLAASLTASVALYVLIYRLPLASGLGPLRNLLATALATLPLAIAARCAETEGVGRLDRSRLLLLFGGLLALRLAIPLDANIGSDDAYRYLWDGKVQAAGKNPFRHAPRAKELAHLVDADFHPKIFRPDMRTVYPPLAQLYFLLAFWLGGMSFVGLKLIYLLHEAASTWLLLALARQRGAPPLRTLIYAWSPLAVVQGFAGNHLDTLLVPWVLLALLLAERRPGLSGAALGLSAMIRPITALGAPALALRRPWREAVALALGFGVAVAVLIAPYARVGVGPLTESLRSYAQSWQFNGSLFELLDALLNQWAPFRLVLYAAISTLALAIGFVPGPRPARLAAALGVYFALAPTVYPWYLLGPLAALALTPGPLRVALPVLVTLSDLVFVDGAVGGKWEVPQAALWVEYVALFALVGYQLWIWRRRERRATV